MVVSHRLAAVARLVYWNARHYLTAVWGFGCRIDPDVPPVPEILPGTADTVLEYRGYGALLVPAVLLAAGVPEIVLWGFLGFLAGQSWARQRHFWNRLTFWGQAFRESPHKERVQLRYSEACMEEIERRMKAGEDYSFWEDEAFRMQEIICGKSLPPVPR